MRDKRETNTTEHTYYNMGFEVSTHIERTAHRRASQRSLHVKIKSSILKRLLKIKWRRQDIGRLAQSNFNLRYEKKKKKQNDNIMKHSWHFSLITNYLVVCLVSRLIFIPVQIECKWGGQRVKKIQYHEWYNELVKREAHEEESNVFQFNLDKKKKRKSHRRLRHIVECDALCAI